MDSWAGGFDAALVELPSEREPRLARGDIEIIVQRLLFEGVWNCQTASCRR